MIRSWKAVRTAILITRWEVLRTWRRLWTPSLLWVVSFFSFGMLYAAVACVATIVFTSRFLVGEGGPDLTAVRAVTLGLVVLGTLLTTDRTVKQIGRLDAPSTLLTAAPAHAVALGLMGAAFVRGLLFGGPLLLGSVLGFWLTIDAPIAAVTLALVCGSVLAFVVVTGFAIGMAIRAASMRSRLIANRSATVTALVGSALIIVVVIAFSAPSLRRSLILLLLRLPLARLGDLALVGTPGIDLSPREIVAPVGLLAIGTPVLGTVAVSLAADVWFSESCRSTDFPGNAPNRRTVIDTRLAGMVSTPTQHVIRKTWLRLRRSPATLFDAMLPYLFPLAVSVPSVATGGGVPNWTMYGVAAAGVAATGVVVALNPIGDEGTMFPVTVLSGIPGRDYFAGLVIVSWMAGLPLTVGGVVVTGLAMGLNRWTVAACSVISAVFALTAPAVALAAGMTFPSTERLSIPGGGEIVEPNFVAFLVMCSALTLAALPLFVLVVFPVDDWQTNIAVGLASAVFAVTVGALAFRHAVARFESYVLPAAFH